jgi:hypothetical protein
MFHSSTETARDAPHSMNKLPEDFAPTIDTVICGRGRRCFNHCGNDRFRATVAGYLAQYSKADSKLEKSYILSDIVAKVRASRPNGGFVKKCPETKRWYEVGDFLAREKTSQAFRDALSDQYKSSNSAKKKRRQVAQAIKFQRAHSASDLTCYSEATEPLDAFNQGGSKYMRVERPRSTSFDDGYLLLGELSEFDGKAVRRGLSTSNLTPSMILSHGASVLPVLDNFNSAGHYFSANSCPEFGANFRTSQLEESMRNGSWGTGATASAFAEQYGPSWRTSQNPFMKSKNTSLFVVPLTPNHHVSSPYSANPLSVGEPPKDELENLDCFEDKDLDGIFDGDDDANALLNNLSNLIDDFPFGDPFEPVPLSTSPGM